MGELFYNTVSVGRFPSWNLLFAKEPEPDVDVAFQESATGHTQSSSFGAPQKPPRLRILILILLLLVVAGGAYFAMDPKLMMTLTGQQQPPPPPTTRPETAVRPTSVPSPSPSSRPMDAEDSDSVTPPGAVPTPSFGEGQRVSVVPNSTSPVFQLALSQDAAGSKPGPVVSTGGTLVVLDAELHGQTWIYLVRTTEGTKGWIPENQLVAKP